jgi:predicted phosphodiesterase
VIRVAAIGDLHVGDDCAVAPPMAELTHVAEDADMLLLAGDLTKCGARAEAACLARTLAALDVPVLGVLGNHDYQSDEAPACEAVLREAGMHLLELDVLPARRVHGHRIGGRAQGAHDAEWNCSL